jgi:hypothetical protein
MKTIPVELAGPTYKDRAGQLFSQKTQNLYLGPGREGIQWAGYGSGAVSRFSKEPVLIAECMSFATKCIRYPALN